MRICNSICLHKPRCDVRIHSQFNWKSLVKKSDLYYVFEMRYSSCSTIKNFIKESKQRWVYWCSILFSTSIRSSIEVPCLSAIVDNVSPFSTVYKMSPLGCSDHAELIRCLICEGSKRQTEKKEKKASTKFFSLCILLLSWNRLSLKFWKNLKGLSLHNKSVPNIVRRMEMLRVGNSIPSRAKQA